MSKELILLDDDIKKSTNSQAAINLMKTCLGSGLLALPILFEESGIVESVLIASIIGFWVYNCATKLVKIQDLLADRFDDYRTHSLYSEICYQAYGKFGEKMFDLMTSVTLIGIGLVYTLTSSEMLSKLPWEKMHLDFMTNQNYCIILVTLLLIPVILLRDMTSLSFSSLLGNIAIISSIAYGLVYNDMNNLLVNVKWVDSSLKGVSNLYGTLLYSFGVIFVALPTVDEMQTPDDFNRILSITTTSSALFYAICNSFLYILFHNAGSGVKGNILENMHADSPFYYIATVLVSLMCVFSYPVTVMPALQLCEPKGDNTASNTDRGIFTHNYKKILFRISVVVLASVTAFFFPSFNIKIMKSLIFVVLLGNFTITLITFVFPPLLYIKLKGEDTSTSEKYHNIILSFLGVASMIFTTVTAIVTLKH